MAKFNVNTGAIYLDCPVDIATAFVEGTPLAYDAINKVWKVAAYAAPGRPVRFVAPGWHSNRDDVKMIKMAKLVWGSGVEIVTSEYDSAVQAGHEVVADNGKLRTAATGEAAIGRALDVQGGLLKVQLY